MRTKRNVSGAPLGLLHEALVDHARDGLQRLQAPHGAEAIAAFASVEIDAYRMLRLLCARAGIRLAVSSSPTSIN